MPKVACVILNFGSAHDTLEALASLTPLRGREELEVIVVDNASTHESRSSLQRFSDFAIHLIPSEQNLGFSGGVNLGIDVALEGNCQYVWLLNNDALVHENCLVELLDAVSSTRSQLVGSLVYYYPEKKKIWFGGGKVHWPWCAAECIGKGKDESSLPSQDHPFPVPFVSGCSMLIGRKLLEEIGKLDDDFFAYGEDLDFCIRVRQRAHPIFLQPRSIVWHKLSQATGGEFNPLKEYYNTRNGFWLIHKHVRPLPLRLVAYGGRALWDIVRIGKSLAVRGKSPFGALRIFLRAVGDFLHGRMGIIRGDFQFASS